MKSFCHRITGNTREREMGWGSPQRVCGSETHVVLGQNPCAHMDDSDGEDGGGDRRSTNSRRERERDEMR